MSKEVSKEVKKEAHSRIGASSMYRWSACPGSVRISKGIEQSSSAYAEEGTKAHELAAKWLEAGCMNFQDPNYPSDMKDAVEVYFNLVTDEAEGCELLIEHRFDLTEIHPGLFGTADAVIYDPKNKLLKVVDYKHGQGILVEAKDNPQLKYYGLGALLSSKCPAKEVELVIVQPRANHYDGPVRRHRFKSFDLVEFAADLENYAKATEAPDAPLVSGDHCKFCPAAGICPELAGRALAISQTIFKPATSYDPQELSETLKKVDLLEDYAKAVRAFAYSEAEHGRCPPGWKLVAKRPSRKWKDDEETLVKKFFTLGIVGDEVLFDKSFKSPAQIEKILPKSHKRFMDELTVSISSGLTLVEESDKRPAALTNAAEVFTKIESPKNEEVKAEDIFN